MDYQFKVGDKGKTRDGKDEYEVLAISHFGRDGKRLVVKFMPLDDRPCQLLHTRPDGRFSHDDSGRDLMPSIEKRTIYVNVYPNGVMAHDNEDDARRSVCIDAIGVAVPVTFEFHHQRKKE